MFDKLSNIKSSIIDDIDRYDRICTREFEEYRNNYADSYYIIFKYKLEKSNNPFIKKVSDVLSKYFPEKVLDVGGIKYTYYTNLQFEKSIEMCLQKELTAVDAHNNFYRYCSEYAKKYGVYLNGNIESEVE